MKKKTFVEDIHNEALLSHCTCNNENHCLPVYQDSLKY